MHSPKAYFKALAIGVVVVSLSGCDLVASGLPCRDDTDCAIDDRCGASQRCIAGGRDDAGNLTPTPDVDAGEPDVPPTDGGEIEPDDAGDHSDAGSDPDGGANVDAGEVDAGEVDAGDVDAGDVDAGAVDAGEVDAGEVDAGDIDAGDIDAGDVDAGEVDAGEVDAGEVDAGDVDAGEVDAGVVDAGPIITTLRDLLEFDVDTVDLDLIVIENGLQDWDLSDCTEAPQVVFDSTTNTFNPSGCGVPTAQVFTRPSSTNANDVAVIAVSNLDVPATKRLRLVGDKPVVLVSISSITVDGAIDASGFSNKNGLATQETHGAGGNDAIVCSNSTGADADESEKKEGHGGGGAGHVHVGGAGGTASKGGIVGGGGAGGLPHTVVGLVGGCRGGNGSGDEGEEPLGRGQGGAAGGAIHLIAKDNVSGSGIVRVTGAGGTEPFIKKHGGGGGGSGGTLMVTSGTQLFMANITVLATGGGGGSGAWNDTGGVNPGRESSTTKPVPLGGGLTIDLEGELPGRGGIGGASWEPSDGSRNTQDAKGGAGGGGGSSGRIQIEMVGAGPCNIPDRIFPKPTANAACEVTTSYCGDGEVQMGEECDLGPFNVAGDVSACGCQPDCTEELCDAREDVEDGEIGFFACAGSDCDETSANPSEAGVFLHCGENTNCSLSCTNDRTCTMVCGDSSDCVMSCTNVNGNGCNMLCEEDAQCAFAVCTNTDCAIWGTDDIPPPAAFRVSD